MNIVRVASPSAPGEPERLTQGVAYRASRQIVAGPTRRIITEGVSWAVYERELPDALERTRTLVFDTDKAARRVRNYPATWYALTDEELAQLARSR